jgi:cytosine deaminase
MAGVVTIPTSPAYWLRNATVPTTLLTVPDVGGSDAPELTVVDLQIREGRIAAVVPAGGLTSHDGASVDLQRGLVWPCLLDLHTHLDKGHTWERAPNPDGTFDGAIRTVIADRAAHWSAEDVGRRMDFGLRCSYAHGTRAVRTHLDSMGPQAAITWPVFEALRKEWTGRLEMQAVSLVPLQVFGSPEGEALADRVAAAGGILGAVGYMSPEIDALLDRMLDLATERRLDLDLHCDESGDVGARSLSRLARAVLRRRFRGRVVCGHCCSLAVQPPDVVAETLDLVVEAGIAVVSLPMCNLYPGIAPGRTPRWRGASSCTSSRLEGCGWRWRATPAGTPSSASAITTCSRSIARRRASAISTGRTATGRGRSRRRRPT